MYLLLAAHADGAALQELTAAGAPDPAGPEPRVVSAAELPGVVRELESGGRAGSGTAPRTGTRPCWLPGWSWNAATTSRLCGAILAHSEFTAHTAYALNAEKLTQDDELQQPPRALQPPPPPADQGALFDDPGLRTAPRHRPRSSAPNTPPSRQPSARRHGARRERRPATTAGSASSCCWPPNPPAP